jgi:hypothetical protein
VVYDNLKHLTTLATATAVVELTIYGEKLVEASLLMISLLLLSVCLALCLIRMVYVAKHIESGESPKDTGYVSGMYFGGVIFFVLFALGAPLWLVFILSVVLTILGLFSTRLTAWWRRVFGG